MGDYIKYIIGHEGSSVEETKGLLRGYATMLGVLIGCSIIPLTKGCAQLYVERELAIKDRTEVVRLDARIDSLSRAYAIETNPGKQISLEVQLYFARSERDIKQEDVKYLNDHLGIFAP